MNILELFFIGVGLSMDAFAVSVCKGLAVGRAEKRHYLCVGLWFGGFQALMPLIGYLLGTTFEQYITAVDHWIAFILLGLIGGGMIKEAFSDEEESCDASFAPKNMLVMAVATSIDALAVGITFALLPGVSISSAISLIGVTTCLCAMIGLKIGCVFGLRYKKKAEITGGVILIFMGLRILCSHLGFFG